MYLNIISWYDRMLSKNAHFSQYPDKNSKFNADKMLLIENNVVNSPISNY